MKETTIKGAVRQSYAKVVTQGGSCCGGNEGVELKSMRLGYTEKEIKAAPDGANLGLGCGNPLVFSDLKEGESVLDLGSGAGFDCFLAANRVGKRGRVIGVDMTPEMIARARENASLGNYPNVEFRLGEIENLPVEDNSIDLVISNCVINLTPEKDRVFREAYRVLKPGGRAMISDVVVKRELPEFLRNSIRAYVECISGAILKEDYVNGLRRAGFREIRILNEAVFTCGTTVEELAAKAREEGVEVTPQELSDISKSILSIQLYARKPLEVS